MKKKHSDLARRVYHLEPEGAYEVLAKAQALEAAGREIIHLEIGQPDFLTFPHIGMAGIRAIATGETRYTPSAGIPALRQAIADYTGERVGLEISPQSVVVGPGAKPLLFFPMMALLEPGDEVIYPEPGFPSYRAIIETMGAEPVAVSLVEESGFSFDMEEFEKKVNAKTRLVIVNSPSNPTGGILPGKDLAAIAAAAREFDFWVLSDEIYTRLIYGDEPVPSIVSIPGMRERTIIMDGFSKTYAMTGWRLGFAVMPPALADKVGLLLTHSVGCTAAFTQIAGIEALRGTQDPVEEVRQIFRERRDAVVTGMNDIPGIGCQVPDGAFYVFPNIKKLGKTSREVADFILEKAGVAVLPGTSFGALGEGYLRLCYANSLDNINRAVEQIKSALIEF